MPHATLERFAYPESLVREFEHWAVLVRPAQVTAGSLVLVATDDDARRWPELPAAAFAELAKVTAEMEAALQAAVGFDKINYLMLMMSDPHVHFHVLPRHETPRRLAGLELADPSWPVAPDISQAVVLSGERPDGVDAALRPDATSGQAQGVLQPHQPDAWPPAVLFFEQTQAQVIGVVMRPAVR